MPFGEYKDFETCVRRNQDKSNPEAYCASIKKRIEGEKLNLETQKNWKVLEYCVPIQEAVKLDNKFLIRGIAINETTTRNNVKYTAEELEKSSHSLRNKPILKDHENKVDSIVGRTTENVHFNGSGKNVLFEGFISNPIYQQMINDKLIQSVSIGATVKDLVEEESEGSKHFIAKGIDFVELSLVAVPADPNAGFAKAMMESFDIKNKIKIEEELKMQEKIIIENLHCPECDKEMADKEELKKHMKAKHKDMEEEKMAEANIAQEFEARIKEKELALTKVSEELKKYESKFKAIEEDRLNSLRNDYKQLAGELKLSAKDVSMSSEETLKMLIESLKEIKASKVEVKEVPKAETKGTVISESKEENPLVGYEVTSGTLRGFAITKSQESLENLKAFNRDVSPFDKFKHLN